MIQPFSEDLEDGELSGSDDGYTPLQRPTVTAAKMEHTANSNGVMPTPSIQMDGTFEDEDTQSDFGQSSDSSSADSDACLKKISDSSTKKRKRKTNRTIMLRVKPSDVIEKGKGSRFRKYNVWTASLQEDDLTENMRGIDVTTSTGSDRNVENYDYSLKYRLLGENSLKRRLSNSADDFSDSEFHQKSKRVRGSVKSRLSQRRPSSTSSVSDNSNEPRQILDLKPPEGRNSQDIAREIANKLSEDKDELLLRVIEVLGTELPIEIYKKTQRIEQDGGMMIMNGKRRRTPGGVFLFLLKNHDRITSDQQKLIFFDERKLTNKWRKENKAMSRHRKVEELKKRLSAKEKDLPALVTRREHYLGSELKIENQAASLSNPPPSPVGQEHSPEYKSHAINHLTHEVSPENPCTSASTTALGMESIVKASNDLVSYEDDFLDVNCGEMDFF